jgi:hypothetical protein
VAVEDRCNEACEEGCDEERSNIVASSSSLYKFSVSKSSCFSKIWEICQILFDVLFVHTYKTVVVLLMRG